MTIAGVTPRDVVEPPTIDALAACVAELYARDRAFAFVGGGTELELGNAPLALDTVVKTTACNRVVDYAPADQTITVEAGMTVGALAATLAEQHQFLALDAPDPERTTIGGAIATNLYGRRRLRFGSLKDTIVGVDIVRPDGVRAHGGGKVVKNVAGFDMPKLMVGSLGTLGAIVSATFRVFPIEERSAAILYRSVNVAQMLQICSEIVTERLVPASILAYDSGAGERYDCVASFEGFAPGVEAQMKTATSIAVRLGLSLAEVSAPLQGSFVATLSDEVSKREAAVRRDAPWRLTVSAAPTMLAEFLSSQSWDGMSRLVYPMLGTAFLAAELLETSAVARWRAALPGGSVVVNAMPAAARASVESWGQPAPAALTIMRRLKANFDPKGLCNAGRFVGGL